MEHRRRKGARLYEQRDYRPSGAVFFVPEDRESGEFERELAGALRDGRADDERWHIRKDGSRFRASGTLTALRGPQNQVIGFAKVMRDVTARVRPV